MPIRDFRYDHKGRSVMVRRHVTFPPESGCHHCGGFDGYGGLFEYGVRAVKTQVLWFGMYCSVKCLDAERGRHGKKL